MIFFLGRGHSPLPRTPPRRRLAAPLFWNPKYATARISDAGELYQNIDLLEYNWTETENSSAVALIDAARGSNWQLICTWPAWNFLSDLESALIPTPCWHWCRCWSPKVRQNVSCLICFILFYFAINMLEAIWPNRCATVETRNVSYYDDESTPVTNICRHCRWLRDVVNTASASELFAGRKRESRPTIITKQTLHYRIIIDRLTNYLILITNISITYRSTLVTHKWIFRPSLL